MMLRGFRNGQRTAESGWMANRSITFRRNKRGIGHGVPDYALFSRHMTVAENLAFPLEVRKIGKVRSEAQVKIALDRFRWGGFRAPPSGTLSGGSAASVVAWRAPCIRTRTRVDGTNRWGPLDQTAARKPLQFEITHLGHEWHLPCVYVTDQTEALTMPGDRGGRVFGNGRIPTAGPTGICCTKSPKYLFATSSSARIHPRRGSYRDQRAAHCLVQLTARPDRGKKPINVTRGRRNAPASDPPWRVEFNNGRMRKGPHTLKAEVL